LFWNPFKDFFNSPERQKPREYKERVTNLGAGLIWDKEGYILTNAHMIADITNEDKISVKLHGEEKSIPAKFVGRDP